MAQNRIIYGVTFGSSHSSGTTYSFSVATGTITPNSGITNAQLIAGVSVVISDDTVDEVIITVENGVCAGTTTSVTWTPVTPTPTPTPTGPTPTPTPTGPTPTPTPTPGIVCETVTISVNASGDGISMSGTCCDGTPMSTLIQDFGSEVWCMQQGTYTITPSGATATSSVGGTCTGCEL